MRSSSRRYQDEVRHISATLPNLSKETFTSIPSNLNYLTWEEHRKLSIRKSDYFTDQKSFEVGEQIQTPSKVYLSRYKHKVSWLLKWVKDVEEIRTLPLDWDSCGAEPPNLAALYWAKTVLEILFSMNFQPTCITPSVENGVGISFIRGKKYADIECFNTGEILAVTSDRQGNPDVWEVTNHVKSIEFALRKIRDFIRG